jgi:hypothetical protein
LTLRVHPFSSLAPTEAQQISGKIFYPLDLGPLELCLEPLLALTQLGLIEYLALNLLTLALFRLYTFAHRTTVFDTRSDTRGVRVGGETCVEVAW